MANRLPIPLETLQKICKALEQEMITCLLQFEAAQEMQVGDLRFIARFARDKAFDLFDQEMTHG